MSCVGRAFWTSAEAAYDDDEFGGPVNSSVFSSTTPRDMPWDRSPRRVNPAPDVYDTAGHKAIATLRNPHSRQSAAFASSSDRFAKVKTPCGDGGASAPYGAAAESCSSGGGGGPRQSAAFASTSRRLVTPKTASPGPGWYSPRRSAHEPAHARSASTLPSAGLASGSERRLPFEAGGGRGTDLQTPPPTQYMPRAADEFGGRGAGPKAQKRGVAEKGAAAMGFTSPRFTSGHYNHSRSEGPGPGAYRAEQQDARTLASAQSGRRLPVSTEPRRIEQHFGIRMTPSSDQYHPAASARGIGDLDGRQDARVPTAAFASGSTRLKVQQTLSPGPGGYYPNDGKTVAAASSTANRPRRLQRSASFGATSRRFASSATAPPGPGSYHAHGGPRPAQSARAAPHASASFVSGSARTQLPIHPMSAIVPGPGGYEHSHPVADYARPLRRSASFTSRSERLKPSTPRDARMTPPPGTYSPQLYSRGHACSSATQRYSISRQWM